MELVENFKAIFKENEEFAFGFIGCGNMSKAIIEGIVKSGMFNPSEILVSATSIESFDRIKHLNVTTTLNNRELVEKCRIIFLCVKPYGVKSVAKQIGKSELTCFRKTLVSVLAGVEIASLKADFEGCFNGMNFIRAMPNTPLMVCAGCTALTNDKEESQDSKINFQVILKIFKTLGVAEIVDESKFHAVTGVSGSGPAYVYIIIEALSDAGVKQGLPRDLATKFAAQTVFGAAKTILDTGMHPGQAKDQVTSPGGTTIHAVHQLEKGRIRDTLINAVEAAAKRSEDLSKH